MLITLKCTKHRWNFLSCHSLQNAADFSETLWLFGKLVFHSVLPMISCREKAGVHLVHRWYAFPIYFWVWEEEVQKIFDFHLHSNCPHVFKFLQLRANVFASCIGIIVKWFQRQIQLYIRSDIFRFLIIRSVLFTFICVNLVVFNTRPFEAR